MTRSRASRALEQLARIDLRPHARGAERTGADDMGDELVRALGRGDLSVHFQPIAELRTGQCRRVEALVRWTHPRAGVIDPRDIIRLAEATGSIGALACWVMAESARRRMQWSRDGLELGVSVNLTGAELVADGPAALLAAIAAARAHPSAFTFEVPAGVLAHGDPRVRQGIRELSRAGARIAADNTSSADAPPRSSAVDLDEIKIARTLVLRAVADPSAGASVRGLVEHARDLGLTCVAVGVEDDATYRLVSAYGCDQAQGFWMSRPLASHDLSRWRGWMARLALGGAAALVAPLGFARVTLGNGTGGAVQATVEPQRASQCCSRVAGTPVVDPGLAMSDRSLDRARVLIEATIDRADSSRIVAAVGGDLVGVEELLGVSFERQPAVYVFATRASFAFALQRSFGQSGTDAGMLAAANGGVAFPQQSAVAINWEAVRGSGSLSVIRHELTHLLVHQIAGVTTDLPAWFDEGLAALSARDAGDTEIDKARDASATLALLTQGRGALTSLSSPAEWTIRNAALGGRAYALSAEAVSLLRQSSGAEGLSQILARAGVVGFGQAFGEARGESVADFAAAFPGRFAAGHAAPQIAQAPRGRSVQWSVSGVHPNALIQVSIDGADYHLEFEAKADGDGVYSAVFGGTAKPGDFSITVLARGTRVSAVLAVR